MKIVSFYYLELNGFLTQKIVFNNDVTFLHGINGSGKTSVLKAITALISPNLEWLVTTPFKQLALEIEYNFNTYQISASKDDNGTNIHLIGLIEGKEESITTSISRKLRRRRSPSPYIWLNPSLPSEAGEHEAKEGDRLLNFLNKLPSPIFLGLDRTTLPGEKSHESSTVVYQTEDVFSSRAMLDDAVDQAANIFKLKYAEVTNQVNKIFSNAQTRLILSLFNLSNTHESNAGRSRIFSDTISSTIKSIGTKQREVARGLRKIAIDQRDINNAVIPFFQEVETRAKNVQEILDQRNNPKGEGMPEGWQETFQDWFSILPNLNLVEASLKIINDVTIQEQETTKIITDYIDVMNSFIGDSGKKISVSSGEIVIATKNSEQKNVQILSSGERQVFVLMTHLAMNSEMQLANVLIIDEPELSLHLKWQKQFVSSVQKLSPQTQIILATHSPEIISRKTSKTVMLKA